MAATTQRWLKFWPQDWESDECLKVCSLAARGLWAAMVCLMHKADPYGHLLVNGKSPDPKRLAAVIGATNEKEVAALLVELESEGVFSRNDKGVIYSRRMVRDKAKSDIGRQNGLDGGNPALTGGVKGSAPIGDKGGDAEGDNRGGVGPDKGRDDGGLSRGAGPTRAQEAEAERERELIAKLSCEYSKPRVSGLEGVVLNAEGRPICGDFYFDETSERVYEAARIDRAKWRGDLRPLIQWLNDGIEPSVIVRVIERKAAREDYKVPFSLGWFTTAINEELGRKPTARKVV